MIKSRTLIWAIAIVLVGLAGGVSSAHAGDKGGILPSPSKAAKGDQCVAPVDVIRREHMNFLKHQRKDTLREGIRGAKYSLKECVACHATPDKAAGGTPTIEPFCSECHAYAAVKIDCFECHTNKPDDAVRKSQSLPTGHDDRKKLLSLLEREVGTKEHAR